jgi:hypothetical protein
MICWMGQWTLNKSFRIEKAEDPQGFQEAVPSPESTGQDRQRRCGVMKNLLDGIEESCSWAPARPACPTVYEALAKPRWATWTPTS